MEQYFEIGEIVNTHGVKGELKVMPLTDQVKRYDDLEWVYVDVNGNMKKYFIEGVRYHKQFVLLKLENVDDMDNASLLKSSFIKIPKEFAIKLPEGSYFISDLIGCSICDKDRGVLGDIVDVIQTGSNDVYLVRMANKKDVLIPAIKDVVKEIDINNKAVKIELLEGLI